MHCLNWTVLNLLYWGIVEIQTVQRSGHFGLKTCIVLALGTCITGLGNNEMHAVSIADCKDSNTIFILPFTMILVVADYYTVLYKMDRKVSMPNIEFSTVARKIVELDTLNWLAGSHKLYKKIVAQLNDTYDKETVILKLSQWIRIARNPRPISLTGKREWPWVSDGGDFFAN